MKYLNLAIILLIYSCSTLNKTTYTKLKSEQKFKDSLINEKYEYLKEYTTCSCITNVYKSTNCDTKDISLSIYAESVNRWGIDTLMKLAKQKAATINYETYQDYSNFKAAFFNCSRWVNSDSIRKVIKSYAESAVSEFIKNEKEERGKL